MKLRRRLQFLTIPDGVSEYWNILEYSSTVKFRLHEQKRLQMYKGSYDEHAIKQNKFSLNVIVSGIGVINEHSRSYSAAQLGLMNTVDPIQQRS